VVDKAYLEKNIADCKRWIESYERRIKNVKKTGEKVDELKKVQKGYSDKLAELTKDL